MDQRAQKVLWIDGGAGSIAGIFVLLLRDWLARLHGFPLALVVFLGIANLSYGSYSGSLALRATRGKAPSRRAVLILIAANLAWVGVCATVLSRTTPTAFGFIHVGFEALFVGTLALVEYRLVLPTVR
ncbi:MAG TPA: hypothetical protein VI299_07470 [Polyangiales bacterium]